MIELENKIPIKIFSEMKEDELTEDEKFKLKQWRESEKIESDLKNKHCKSCGIILRAVNKTGYCRVCYRKISGG